MKTLDFCGYTFEPNMENGRIIHPDYPYMWYDWRQIDLDGNELALFIEKESAVIHHWDGKEYHPQLAVGLIRSVETFCYGTFSAEIQLPKGKNLWPAFWLVGEGKWPKGGEIDIMEAWSDKCGSYFRATIPQPPYLVPSWDTTTNVHWYSDTMHKSTGSRRLPLVCSLKNPTNHYKKYEVEWRQDIIKFKVNGKTVRTYGEDVTKHLYDKKMHVVFDLWTTGLNYSLETPMMIKNFTYEPIEIL